MAQIKRFASLLALILSVLLAGTVARAEADLARSISAAEASAARDVSRESDQTASEPSRSVAGGVLDPSGAGVPSAQVTLTSADGRIVAHAATDNAGAFHFEKLAMGGYSIDVQADGFRETKLDITVGKKPLGPLRINLPIASRNEVVSVGAQDTSARITTDVAENQNANTIDRTRITSRRSRASWTTIPSGRTVSAWW